MGKCADLAVLVAKRENLFQTPLSASACRVRARAPGRAWVSTRVCTRIGVPVHLPPSAGTPRPHHRQHAADSERSQLCN